MLKRLYVDNYKCLVNFEFQPPQHALILGKNGTGKSAVFDVIASLRGWEKIDRHLYRVPCLGVGGWGSDTETWPSVRSLDDKFPGSLGLEFIGGRSFIGDGFHGLRSAERRHCSQRSGTRAAFGGLSPPVATAAPPLRNGRSSLEYEQCHPAGGRTGFLGLRAGGPCEECGFFLRGIA